jgi:hypothetical protein
MLLDVVLIAEEGSSVCRAIRRHGGVPVIMLGDHTFNKDVGGGLEAVAGDSVTAVGAAKVVCPPGSGRCCGTESRGS